MSVSILVLLDSAQKVSGRQPRQMEEWVSILVLLDSAQKDRWGAVLPGVVKKFQSLFYWIALKKLHWLVRSAALTYVSILVLLDSAQKDLLWCNVLTYSR